MLMLVSINPGPLGSYMHHFSGQLQAESIPSTSNAVYS